MWVLTCSSLNAEFASDRHCVLSAYQEHMCTTCHWWVFKPQPCGNSKGLDKWPWWKFNGQGLLAQSYREEFSQSQAWHHLCCTCIGHLMWWIHKDCSKLTTLWTGSYHMPLSLIKSFSIVRSSSPDVCLFACLATSFERWSRQRLHVCCIQGSVPGYNY